MKKILYIGVALLAFIVTSCAGNASKTSESQEVTKNDGVEILYFHGKQRCITCNAIERLTTEVINETFAQELKDGKLSMQIIDISTPEGEAIADRYEVTWSSLFFNKWEDGNEARNNITQLGFAKAKNMPKEFKSDITNQLTELLK